MGVSALRMENKVLLAAKMALALSNIHGIG